MYKHSMQMHRRFMLAACFTSLTFLACYVTYHYLKGGVVTTFKQPLAGVYLSFFLMLTLMILVAATWMGLYIAKRITRPVQMLAAAANEIGAGHLDHRVEAETRDEFGSLVEAFNTMAARLDTSQRELESEKSRVQAILESVGAGVVALDRHGRVRLLTGTVSGCAVAQPMVEIARATGAYKDSGATGWWTPELRLGVAGGVQRLQFGNPLGSVPEVTCTTSCPSTVTRRVRRSMSSEPMRIRSGGASDRAPVRRVDIGR